MSQLYKYTKDLLEKLRIMEKKLSEKIEVIEKHHKDCNISKTTAASAGIVGTIGLFLAPFTGGLSTLVAGVATTLIVAGNLTSIGTTIADGVMSQEFVSDVNNLVKSEEAAAEKFKNLVENLELIAMAYRDLTGCEDNYAWSAVLYECIYGTNNVFSGVSTIMDTRDAAEAARIARNLAALHQPRGSGGIELTRLPTGATTGRVSALGSIANDFGNRVRPTRLGRIPWSAVGKTLLVVGNAIEIMSVVSDWNSKHPTLKEVETARDNLKHNIDFLEKLLKAIESGQVKP